MDRKEYITDPYGNKFKTIKEMCSHYNIDYTVYRNRMKSGWTQEEALGIVYKKKVTDPFGNSFKTK